MADRSGEAITTPRLAQLTRVPPGYLSKVLQRLGRADLVRAQRGVGGGFTLARHPKEISVLDVVNAVDPVRRIRECPLRIGAHGRQLCALHRRMDDALAMLERTFAETRIEDVLRSTRAPLCPAGETIQVTRARGRPRRT